ncbi:MAG: hypothetical protein MJ193_05215, partial [Clostridia bacterium]|nr:hypothetical protein [Clostridia bacterium]
YIYFLNVATTFENGVNYYIPQTAIEDGVEYVVLDTTKLPTGKAFPAGVITWNESDFHYSWKGGTIDVSFTYQWGFAEAVTETVSIAVTGYEINTEKALEYTRSTDGRVATGFDVADAFTISSYLPAGVTVADHVRSFDRLAGKYTSGKSFENLQVKWDLEALENRLNEIKRADGGYDYYKGIDVTVTAYVGGDVFFYVVGYDAEGNAIYGLTSNGSTASEYAENGYIAQAMPVRVYVAPRTFEKLASSTLDFDPYASATLNGDAFDDDVAVKFAGIDKPVVLEDGQYSIEAPFVLNGEQYVPTTVSADDLTYNGYAKDEQLFAKLTIGNDKSGVQEAYVKINVLKMTAKTTKLSVKSEHTYNPEWFNETWTEDGKA